MNLGYALLGATLFLIACGPSDEDVQSMVNKAVEGESVKLMQLVVEEAKKNPGPAGERGERGERGPDVSDERLAQGIKAALESVELPVGPPGPAGPKGDPGERGPDVSDERLAQGIMAALETVELPVGPPGPAGPKGDPGKQAEIPAELLDNQIEITTELEEGLYGVQFIDKTGIPRIELLIDDNRGVMGIDFMDEAGIHNGGVWAIENTLVLGAPDGSLFCIDKLGASSCGNLFSVD